jgi:hypothetical protein
MKHYYSEIPLMIEPDFNKKRHCEVRSNLYAIQNGSACLEIASYLAMTPGKCSLIPPYSQYGL